MTIAFAIHEATRTGAPRLGALIAREWQAREEVRVLVMKDGPLRPWLEHTLGARNVTIAPGDPFDYRVPFEQRVRLAAEMLERAPADVVYVNSLAASVFALAAAAQKRKTVLHVHEKTADMANLLLHDVTKLEVMRVVDAAVLAARDISADLAETFRYAPPEIETFGVAIDIEAVRDAARLPAPVAVNARGEPLRKGERLLVGMSGHASARKGVDVFYETAAALPACDFLWVGGWKPEETVDNVIYEHFQRAGPQNLYAAGAVDNPYPLMAMMDVFFLSSREDPNPLVLGEALALGLPVLAFSRTSGIADRLGRWATLCYGRANAPDAIRALRATSAEAARRPEFRHSGEAFLAEYDLRAKMPKLFDLVVRLRGGPPPLPLAPSAPPMEGATKRDLADGVVELDFT